MTYQTLLFDLDHTLYDSDASEIQAFAHTMRSVGVDQPEVFLSTYIEINNALWRSVERGEITPDAVRVERFHQLVSAIGLDADPHQMADLFADGLGAFGELHPGAREALDELICDHTLAMLTNGLSEVQWARINRLDLGQYFSAIVISAEVGHSKPSARFFDVALETLGNPDRQSALMIGDSLSADIRGAAAYGLATCWYNPHAKIAAPDDGVTHEISHLSELVGVVTAGR
jgi:2-haloacid dehalogenase